MEQSTIEQQVIIEHLNKLVTSIQLSVESINDHCRSKKLISKDVYDNIRYTKATPGEKARTLLQAVCDCMEHKNDCFEKFLDILAEEPMFDDHDLIQQLKDSKREAEDQVVPDGDDDLFDDNVSNEETGVFRRRQKWKDSGFQSQSSSVGSMDSNCADQVLTPHPTTTMPQMSKDSGISTQISRDSELSLGSSTDLNEPVQETTQGHVSTSKLDGCHQQQPRAESTRMKAIKRLKSVLRNLEMETLQHEAKEIDLKDKVDSLSKQLDETVRDKKKTEETLAEKKAVVKYLERRQDELNTSLAAKESELQALKSKVSVTEVDKEELRKTCSEYEDQIASLKTELAKVSAEYDIKEKDLEETNELLKLQTECVDKLKTDISELEQENCALSYKYATKSKEKRKILKEFLCMERQILCFMAIIVICVAIILSLAGYNYVLVTETCTK